MQTSCSNRTTPNRSKRTCQNASFRRLNRANSSAMRLGERPCRRTKLSDEDTSPRLASTTPMARSRSVGAEKISASSRTRGEFEGVMSTSDSHAAGGVRGGARKTERRTEGGGGEGEGDEGARSPTNQDIQDSRDHQPTKTFKTAKTAGDIETEGEVATRLPFRPGTPYRSAATRSSSNSCGTIAHRQQAQPPCSQSVGYDAMKGTQARLVRAMPSATGGTQNVATRSPPW